MQKKWKLSKIYYGWWIVLACFICAMTTGVVGYGFTAFFNPVIQEFGWSYASISLAASIRGAETGLAAPALGILVDRWGSKWILFAGAILTGLGLIILAQTSHLAQFYGAFIIISLGTSCCGPGVVNSAINHWFRRNLGKATGILAAGFGASGLLVPVIYTLIESYGWRGALVILGIGCMVICLPLILIVKRTPEQYGYVPDGDPRPKDIKVSGNPQVGIVPVEVSIDVSGALKSRAFWHLTLALTLQSIVVMAVINHIMPYLQNVNIDGTTASYFAGAIPVLSIIGRFGSGWLSDKFNRKRVIVVSFAIFGIGTLLFDYVRDVNLWLLFLSIPLFSISMGSVITLRAVMSLEYFCRSRFATIFGILIGIQSLGTILGPFLAGWIFDVWNSYHYAWLIFTGINLISLVLIATIPRVQVKKAAEV